MKITTIYFLTDCQEVWRTPLGIIALRVNIWHAHIISKVTFGHVFIKIHVLKSSIARILLVWRHSENRACFSRWASSGDSQIESHHQPNRISQLAHAPQAYVHVFETRQKTLYLFRVYNSLANWNNIILLFTMCNELNYSFSYQSYIFISAHSNVKLQIYCLPQATLPLNYINTTIFSLVDWN